MWVAKTTKESMKKKICLMVIIFTTITTMMTSDGSSTEDGGDENRWKSLNLVFTYITHKHKWKIIIFYGKYRSCWKYTKKKSAQCCFFCFELGFEYQEEKNVKKGEKIYFSFHFVKRKTDTHKKRKRHKWRHIVEDYYFVRWWPFQFAHKRQSSQGKVIGQKDKGQVVSINFGSFRLVVCCFFEYRT